MLRKLSDFIKPNKNTGETEFLAAKKIWEETDLSNKIVGPISNTKAKKKAYLSKETQEPLHNVIKLLKKAARKGHYDAMRCYATLLLFSLLHELELLEKPRASFEDVRKIWLQKEKKFHAIIVLLDQPKFAEDYFSNYVIYACLLLNKEQFISRLLNNLEKSKPMYPALFMAFAIVKAKELNYSIPNIQRAFVECDKDPMTNNYVFNLYLMQSEVLLKKLKSYTLNDAKEMLKMELPKLPFHFFGDSSMPQGKEDTEFLMKIIGRLESAGNTRNILPAIGLPQQQPLEEKPEEPKVGLAEVTKQEIQMNHTVTAEEVPVAPSSRMTLA